LLFAQSNVTLALPIPNYGQVIIRPKMDTGDWSSGETRNESSPRGRPACWQQGLPFYWFALPASPPDSVSFFQPH